MRDFTYDEEAIEKQKRDLEALVVEEKDMWVRQRAVLLSCCPPVFPHQLDVAKATLDPSLTLTTLHPQADLLRLSRINFSELFQVLVHLKVVRAYVESVLRYGLPAAYFGAVIKVRLCLLCSRCAPPAGAAAQPAPVSQLDLPLTD